MLPRLGTSKLVSTWIWITLIVSIVATFDGGWIVQWTALAPAQIWRGQVWRLVTWVFVEPGPLWLIVTCMCIYRFGSDLAYRWGDRRFCRFMVEVLGIAAIATVVLALVSDDAWRMYRLGGWAVGDVLVIAWARQFPDSPVVVYSLVRLNGRNLITIVIAMTGVYAIFAGPLTWAPELIACAAAFWYPPRRLARKA
jgi:membrane associated rhomboid family serine protease